ncbi:MAG: AAA family ATPase [Candidatus Dojkabacteria bacterium]
MPILILIGGAPCSGKSTIARELGYILDARVVSTDDVRSEMQESGYPKEKYPNLFDSNSPEEYFIKYKDAKQVVKQENLQSLDVQIGIDKLISSNAADLIIEGVAITPQYVKKLTDKGYDIKYIFLIEKDKQQIRSTVFTRGVWDDADKYSDEIKEKEVVWVLEYNLWLEKEVLKYNFKFISADNKNQMIEQAESLTR